MAAPQWVGVREFARERGVSAPYISQLIGAGRILKSPEGKIDRLQANAVLDAVRVKADGKRRQPGQDAPGAPEVPAAGRTHPDSAAAAYTQARAVRETAAARLGQLEYRRRIGELAEVAEFVRGVKDSYGPIVRELRNLPDRCAARVAASAANDTRKARDIMAAEVEKSLASIADVIAALVSSAGQTRQ